MLSRDEILARKVGKGKVELPSGGEVAIRAITRDEVYAAEEIDKEHGRAERDNFIVSKAMTDPVMSRQDVAEWGASGSAGDITAVLERVSELSGLSEGARKRSVRNV
jgi:hypothetical protein